jgi:hypothetical protein
MGCANVMNTHKLTRVGNEWQCSLCGKAWHVKDSDVPDCVSSTQHKLDRLKSIRKELKL